MEETLCAFHRQDSTLQDIKGKVVEAQELVITTSAASRADWMNQIGQDLKEQMCEVVATNVKAYQCLSRIENAAPIRPMNDTTFTFKDPLGPLIPFSLQFVTSWEAFVAILDTGLRGTDPHVSHSFQIKRYILRDGNERLISVKGHVNHRWEDVFFPGRVVEMFIGCISIRLFAEEKGATYDGFCSEFYGSGQGELVSYYYFGEFTSVTLGFSNIDRPLSWRDR